MDIVEAQRRLALFEIPEEGDAKASGVRKVLAGLLASRVLSLGELQIARDIVCRSQGADPSAYLFLAGMFVSLHGGNTAFNPLRKENENGKLLSAACRVDDDGAGSDIDALERAVSEMWPEAQAAAEKLDGDVVSKDGDGFWYFSRNMDAVRQVSKAIKDRLSESGVTIGDEEVKRFCRYKGKNGNEYLLNDEQRAAVRAAVEHNLTVITGGPGTGKTTIVCSILRSLIKTDGLKVADVALAAPTARAGQRMGEALGKQCASFAGDDSEACDAIATLSGMTVHSLLGGYAPNWKYNAENPLPHRLVVVDECSMVDLLLMGSLLAALRKDCRLVLLGDKNQLPSVEAGAVLGDLMLHGREDNGKKASFPELKESHRFTGRLKTCAEEFNAGKADTIMSEDSRLPVASETWTDTVSKPETENGCFWYGLSGDGLPQKVDELLLEWGRACGLAQDGTLARAARGIKDDDAAFDGECTKAAQELFDILDASRILAVVRNGPFGVNHVNELMLKAQLGRNPPKALADAGIPVMITVNTGSLNLYNGDVGVTVKTPGRGVSVLFPRGKRVVCCPVSQLPEHELAYAMTVHKSQGSEFENVLVVLPDDKDHPLLNRQIVYTGITRAKKRAVIVATKSALEHAVDTKLQRDTGINLGAPG